MAHPPATRVSFAKPPRRDAKCAWRGVSFDSRVSSLTCVVTNIVRQFRVRIGPRGRTDTPVCPADIAASHADRQECLSYQNRRLRAYIFSRRASSSRKWARTIPGSRERSSRSSRSRRARSGRNESTRRRAECGWRNSAIRTFISFDHFSCFAMAATVLRRKAILRQRSQKL